MLPSENEQSLQFDLLDVSDNYFTCPLPLWCSDTNYVCATCDNSFSCTSETPGVVPSFTPEISYSPSSSPVPDTIPFEEDDDFDILQSPSSSRSRTPSRSRLQLLLPPVQPTNDQVIKSSTPSVSAKRSKSPTLSTSKSATVVVPISNGNVYVAPVGTTTEILNSQTTSEVELVDGDDVVATVVASTGLVGTQDFVLQTSFQNNVLSVTIRPLTGSIVGNEQHQLDSSVYLCLTSADLDGRDPDDLCLGFFNTETRKWECEDCSLDETNSSSGRPLLCGSSGKYILNKSHSHALVDHLTNFALLLKGKDAAKKCDSSTDFVIVWLSIASLVAACVVVIVVVIAIEIFYILKWIRRKLSLQAIDEMSSVRWAFQR